MENLSSGYKASYKTEASARLWQGMGLQRHFNNEWCVPGYSPQVALRLPWHSRTSQQLQNADDTNVANVVTNYVNATLIQQVLDSMYGWAKENSIQLIAG